MEINSFSVFTALIRRCALLLGLLVFRSTTYNLA